jgi:phosphoserine phosphatase
MVDIKEYFKIKNYTIKDGLISADDDDVELIKKVEKLPVQFGHISAGFYCYNNQLTSLEGAPQSLGGNFDCRNNQLTSLEGAPQSVGGYFYCAYNQLTSLEGAPNSVGIYFDCRYNKLTSLEGAPKEVGGVFYCDWSEDLPLLRLVRYQNVRIFNNDQVNDIINKYSYHKPLKEAILLCQKELIDKGFIGNAAW